MFCSLGYLLSLWCALWSRENNHPLKQIWLTLFNTTHDIHVCTSHHLDLTDCIFHPNSFSLVEHTWCWLLFLAYVYVTFYAFYLLNLLHNMGIINALSVVSQLVTDWMFTMHSSNGSICPSIRQLHKLHGWLPSLSFNQHVAYCNDGNCTSSM